jgi:hypothetical protein
VENCVCLSRGVKVVGVTWRATTRIMAEVRDLVQRTENSCTGQVLGGRRSGGRVTSRAVCTLHVETRNTGFLDEPQNVDGLLVVWPQNQ